MKKPIKSAIQDFYCDKKLSADDLDCLHKMAKKEADSHHQTSEKTMNLFNSKRRYFIGSFIFLLMVSFWSWENFSFNNKTQEIYADVIHNHFSNKELQYQSQSLTQLGSTFSYLGFMVSDSPLMNELKGQLTGARPCLILKTPAVQLRYQSQEGLWETVFQSRYVKSIHGDIPDRLHNKPPLSITKHGIHITLWRENDLLFAISQAKHK